VTQGNDSSRPPAARRLVLESVARRCTTELEMDAATIAVASGPGSWMPAYATDPSVEQLEQFAFTVGEGPCFDTLRDHAPVIVPDLSRPAAGHRWPIWTSRARELNISTVAAFPIQAGAIAAGALTVYATEVTTLDADRYALALRLADVAFLGLLDLKAGLDDSTSTDQDLSILLRADVHRAAGMVMAQAAIPIDEALARLRAYAFSSGRPLTEIAADVVNRRLRFEPEPDRAE
jgi:ANTAR domain-containing protein